MQETWPESLHAALLQSSLNTVARVILLKPRSDMAAAAQDATWLLAPLGVRGRSSQKPTRPCAVCSNPPTSPLPLQPLSPSCGAAGKMPASGPLSMLFLLPGVLFYELFSWLSASQCWVLWGVTFLNETTLITPSLKPQISSTPSQLHLFSFCHFPTYLVISHLFYFLLFVPTSGTSPTMEYVVFNGRDLCLFC